MMSVAPLIHDVTADRRPTAGRRLTVGLDVGGTKTACVVTDEHDQVLLREVVPTNADQLSDQLAGLVRSVTERVAATGAEGRVAAVGVAIPGHVETESGTVGLAVNLGGHELALGPEIERSVGLPCYVEHDARAAAAWLVEREGSVGQDLAYVSLGTGISAGVVVDGRLLRGPDGLAGEIGHVSVDPTGRRCACGLRGCLETVAAGPAIARLARSAVAAGRPTRLPADATAADVFRAAAAGDELAAELTAAVAEWLARAIRGLLLTVGVRHVILGGGVAAAGDALLVPLLKAIASERAASPLADAVFAQTNLEMLPPDVDAGARGAAAIARRRLNAEHGEGVG
jgi:glucokinase